MAYDENTSIKALGLSVRATNALLRNEITTIKDLLAASEMELYTMRGIGMTVLEEIMTIRNAISSDGIDAVIEEMPTYSFGDYLKNICRSENAFQITVWYYNNYSRGAMKEIGDNYGVTRSRIQQIIAKNTERLRVAYLEGTIKSNTLAKFDNYAIQKTEVHTIISDDNHFTGSGLAYLASSFANSKYKVFSNSKINGSWLVFADDNVDETFNILLDDLKHRSEPLLIADVETLYGINDDMLMSIKGIIEKQGYVTHENNKYSTGKDRHYIIRKYIETVDRPASMSEIADNTSLSFEQVRGAISDKQKYINVGKSVYDLVERQYEECSIEDLAINILTAEERALKINYLIKYIHRYNDANDYEITYSLLGSQNLKSMGDFFLLADWGADKIQKKKITNYSISLDDAVLEIISKNNEVYDFEKIVECLKEYGDSVSQVSSSIKTTLSRLADKGLIKRVGGARTGCYMRVSSEPYLAKEKTTTHKTIDDKLSLGKFINASIGEKIEIRYKTERKNSENRWRTISVRGQDARYIYTNDLNTYGKRVKYVKDKVVDFRDLSTATKTDDSDPTIISNETTLGWYEDVSACVDELDTVFTIEEVYAYEAELSKKHPDNINIRAKIRQQLQVMCDKSVIDFIAPGVYQKRQEQ